MRRLILYFLSILVIINKSAWCVEACDCKSALLKIDPKTPAIEDTNVACKRLAVYIIDKHTATFSVKIDSVPQSILQPLEPRTSSAQGTAGQTNAIPSIEPVALTGGSIAMSGTGDGTQAVTAISVNPSLFAAPKSESFSKFSRFSDITVLLPVSLFQGDIQSGLNFIGINARMNVIGPSEGEALFEKQKKQIEETFDKALNADARILERIEEILKGSSDVCGCAEALYGDSLDLEKVRESCGKNFTSISNPIYNELYDLVTQAQELADSRYFGLDIRFERSIKTDTNSSTSLFCGLAGGRKIGLKGPANIGLRTWLGLQYVDADSAKPGFAADGAIGVVINRSFGPQLIEFAAGLEGRMEMAKKSDTGKVDLPNMSIIRISLSIPFMASNSLSIGATIPISGDEKPMINVGYNWSLMLPDNMKNFVDSFSRDK